MWCSSECGSVLSKVVAVSRESIDSGRLIKGAVSQAGACLLPKRAMDVMSGEVVRLLRLSNNCINPVSFVVPRKVAAPCLAFYFLVPN